MRSTQYSATLLSVLFVLSLGLSTCGSNSDEAQSTVTGDKTSTVTITSFAEATSSTPRTAPVFPPDPGPFPKLLTDPITTIPLSENWEKYYYQEPIYGEGYKKFVREDWDNRERTGTLEFPHERADNYFTQGSLSITVDAFPNLNGRTGQGFYTVYRNGELQFIAPRTGNQTMPTIFATSDESRIFTIDEGHSGANCNYFSIQELTPNGTVSYVNAAGAVPKIDEETRTITQSGLGGFNCYTPGISKEDNIGKMGSWQITDEGIMQIE